MSTLPRNKSRASRKAALRPPQLQRTHVVWGSLLGAMTVVGGLLLLLQEAPGAASAQVPLVQVSGPERRPDFAAVFDTATPIEAGRWTGIVIHHSGSAVGSASTLTDQHNAKGFKGLGFHFVISNGQGAADGQVFVGYRWQDQLPGVHVSGPKAELYNRQTIGICLIGDGERREFTEAQVTRLAALVRSLQDKLGIPDAAVVLHRDVAPTGSPGRFFPEMAFRQRLAGLR